MKEENKKDKVKQDVNDKTDERRLREENSDEVWDRSSSSSVSRRKRKSKAEKYSLIRGTSEKEKKKDEIKDHRDREKDRKDNKNIKRKNSHRR